MANMTIPRSTRFVHPLLTEVTLLLVLFAAYKWGRQLVETGVAQAMTNATWLWDLERTLHLPNEQTLQKLVLHWEHTAFLSNLYYVGVHFPGTAALLIWLWTRHRAHYKRIRTELVILTAAGMAVHVLFPLAPPRLAGLNMTDTMLTVGPSAYPAAADGIANQYAAMPSLHVGWALLVSLAVLRVSSSRWRWLIAMHAPITVFVVVITANHYWLDGLVAAALLAAAMLTLTLIQARRTRTAATQDTYTLAA
ncbi:phosphatase PAP2 family protein [Actinomadura sp. 6N118]|uniref:phosphatase PAP2 family protein n=1 Tax=Actinomadura sp. 6N118 TaxID=3375151 RepID=UPI00378968CD